MSRILYSTSTPSAAERVIATNRAKVNPQNAMRLMHEAANKCPLCGSPVFTMHYSAECITKEGIK